MRYHKGRLIYFFLFFSITNSLFAGNDLEHKNIQSNYEIFDSISKQFARDIFSQTVSGKYSEVNFKITDIPSSRNILREFANLCIDNNLKVSNDSSIAISHNININRFEMTYKVYHESPDSLIREYLMDSFISGEKAKFSNFAKYSYKYSDTISRDDILFVQSSSAQHTNAPVPERDRTFFEKALEPVILVSVAILSVIILYTVRSN